MRPPYPLYHIDSYQHTMKQERNAGLAFYTPDALRLSECV